MAVASLRYRPHGQPPEENKHGYVIYSGTAVVYHHWRFRTELKVVCVRDRDEYQNIAQQVVESLRGDPLQAAVDIGIATLTSQANGGIKKLMDTVRDQVFPSRRKKPKLCTEKPTGSAVSYPERPLRA